MENILSLRSLILIPITIAAIISTVLLVAALPALSEANKADVSDKGDKSISDDDMIELESDMDLLDLINAASEINNEAYILDESVKAQKITIITPEGGMDKEDFLKFFDVILNLNGLSVVKTDGINKVISSSRIKEESTPTVIELNE